MFTLVFLELFTLVFLDILERIRKYEDQLSNVSNCWLCTDIVHYAASYGDKGWGCGYRNFQMLLSSLATNPTYCKILFNGKYGAELAVIINIYAWP